MYFYSNQISANATYEFWRRAHSITSDWWALSGAFADQSNDLDMNLIATLVFLEGAIESLEHLSTQGVDARAVQTIWNVLQCMNSFYSIGREVVDYNYRYGSRLPPEISGRVGAAVFALIIQYGLVQSEYTQTAQTLSVEYGRRFPGGN